MRRRVTFSAPLVLIAACKRPLELPAAVDDEPVVARGEADAGVTQIALQPHVATPDELVDHLPPLAREKTLEEVCRNPRNHCNPPRPGTVVRPSAPTAVQTEDEPILAIAETADGTLVRVSRPDRADQTWRAVFVTATGQEDPGPPCVLGDWDYSSIDCLTSRSAMQLVDANRLTLRLRLIPPPELVARNERERATYVAPPPKWRVLGIRVDGDRTVVVVGAGRNDGIEKTTRVRFASGDHDAPDGACEIVRIDQRTTTCRTTLSPDQIRALGADSISTH